MSHKNVPSPGTAKRLQNAFAFSALLFVTGCIANAESYSMLPAPAPAPYVNVPPGHMPSYSMRPAPAPYVNVPPGHMPQPGRCRVWFPNRPPGQQPPPGSCNELRFKVPPGAHLVRG